jgi:hypothetical protein
MNQFYVLENYIGMDTKRYAGGQYTNRPTERCLICNTFVDLSNPIVPEAVIALDHLGRLGFTESLWASIPVFRQDVFGLLEQSHVTGYVARRVHLIDRRKDRSQPLPKDIPSYAQLVPTSYVRLAEPPPIREACPRCGFIKYAFPEVGTHLDNGMRIDPSTWDGADIFCVRGYGFVFCTRRVAEAMLKAGFNQRVVFIKMENWCRWEEFSFSKWSIADHDQHVESFLIRRVEDL